MYKEWMLLFQWEVNGELINETFFFDSKENMIKFVKNDKSTCKSIRVAAACKLEYLDKEIFT